LLFSFAGIRSLTIALIIWVALYTLVSNSNNPFLAAIAPYLEAFSITGQCLFAILAVVISWLTYILLRPRRDNETST
jgi:uncharacterized membrane protein (DUF485 family)